MFYFLFWFIVFYVTVAASLSVLIQTRMGITLHWGTFILIYILMQLGFQVGCGEDTEKRTDYV